MRKIIFFSLMALLISNCAPTQKKGYQLSSKDLSAVEKKLDHAGFIQDFDAKALVRGERIYNANCINCHGNEENEGSIPSALKFWSDPFKMGSDAFAMYQTRISKRRELSLHFPHFHGN